MTGAPSLKLYSKAPRQYREAKLHQAVVQWLRIAGVQGMFFFHPANEGQRSAHTGAFLKSIGLRPGVADLVIIMPGGKAYFLELKAKNEKQSPEQVAFAADCGICGCHYALVDNIDDALRVLREWKAIEADMAGRWGRVTTRRAELKAMQAGGIG